MADNGMSECHLAALSIVCRCVRGLSSITTNSLQGYLPAAGSALHSFVSLAATTIFQPTNSLVAGSAVIGAKRPRSAAGVDAGGSDGAGSAGILTWGSFADVACDQTVLMLLDLCESHFLPACSR